MNKKISLKRFKKLIMEAVKNKPPNIRYGQCVFNFIEENFHVARQIQMEDNIDCFYDDTKVPLFIMNAWYRYNSNNSFSRTRLYSEHGYIDVYYYYDVNYPHLKEGGSPCVDNEINMVLNVCLFSNDKDILKENVVFTLVLNIIFLPPMKEFQF